MSKRIFISSTSVDLADYRETVQRAIRQLGAIDVSMENFGGRDERPKDECLRLIEDESDVFVGIYAYRYGYVPKGDSISLTQAEYEAATLAGLKRFIYLVGESVPWVPAHIDKNESEGKLNEFKDKLKANHMCQFFSNKDDLAAKVAADLGRHFSLQDLKHVTPSIAKDSESLNAGELKTMEEWNKHRDGIKERNRGVFLVHVITPSKIKGQKFDIFIYLKRNKSEDISDIDSAKFFLGRHWGNEIFEMQNEGDYIGISTSAYGPFLCTCCVTFKDGYSVHVNRYIDFEMESVYK
jgi:Domain of unknown function (DUF4062)